MPLDYIRLDNYDDGGVSDDENGIGDDNEDVVGDEDGDGVGDEDEDGVDEDKDGIGDDHEEGVDQGCANPNSMSPKLHRFGTITADSDLFALSVEQVALKKSKNIPPKLNH